MSARLREIRVRDFDIKHTFESAQPLTFYADYDYADGVLTYPCGKGMITAFFSGDSKNCSISAEPEAHAEIAHRLRLDDNMQRIYRSIGTDRFVRATIGKYRGMRLTLNEPWVTTVCFIISQFNNVKRITMITHNILNTFGTPITYEGVSAGKAFPSCEELLKVPEKKFGECGAGFRAKYLVQAADFCAHNLDLEKLEGRSYCSIKEQLMEIPGVGDKVADCIALMGYGKLEAFPIDVWVKRTLENLYFRGNAKKISDLHEFAEEKFGRYAGYAQQYLFHSSRINKDRLSKHFVQR
jgi:N-glycosylase/DNA lyase